MTDAKAKIVNGMCQTWRHDFGLEKRTHHFGSTGMTDEERESLTRRMAQMYEHYIAPYVAEIERLEGVEQAHKTACNVRNRLISENQALQKDAERGRLLKLLAGGRANEVADWNIDLRADVNRLKRLVGEPVPPSWEEFVGPRPENIASRLRRKLAAQKGDQQ